MKPAIAAVAMAAFCAFATAAPLGSLPHQPHSTHPAVPVFEIPLDPDLEAPELDGGQIPGIRAEAVIATDAPAAPARQALIVPILLGSATLGAFGCLFIVTSRSLKTKPGRRKRLEYSCRTMAPLT